MQAKILNGENTDLNVVVGLCVGHDSLFMKYSDAIVTTLIVKDKVLGHNPASTLYNSNSYYRRLLQKGDIYKYSILKTPKHYKGCNTFRYPEIPVGPTATIVDNKKKLSYNKY